MFLLALRTLSRQKRRFLYLALTIALGSALVFMVSALLGGLSTSIEQKSRRYFGGDYTITAYTQFRQIGLDLAPESRELLEARFGSEHLLYRSMYFNDKAQLYHQGSYQPLRRIVGIDASREGVFFPPEDFVQGGLAEVGTDGVLVSEPVGRALGLESGSTVTLVLYRDDGVRTSIDLVVSGLFDESSLFAYAVYLDRRTLNTVLGYPVDQVSDVGILGTTSTPVIRSILEPYHDLVPPMDRKSDLDAYLYREFENPELAVLDLAARMDQVTQILTALDWTGFVVFILLVLVLAIGVSNTFRMIVRERMLELGTMRALGVQRTALGSMIMYEALLVLFVGGSLGALIAVVGSLALSQLDLSGNGLLDLFLERGRLEPHLSPVGFFQVTLALVLGSLWGVAGPAFRAARVHPAQAIRSQ